MTKARPIVISWIGFHGRSASLAKAVDGEAVFLSAPGKVLFRYVKQYRATVEHLRQNPHSPVIVMLPPLPALVAAIWGRGDSQQQVLADLHTGVFEDPKWRWARVWTMRLIQRHCTAAIVTNESLAARARAAGIREVLVLDDIIEPRPYHGRSGHVVFPVTYANDEPIREILDAARLTPEVQFVLTGRAPDWVKELAPSNVTLPGFVSRAEFEALLEEASVVGALTNRPYTMQRAGYEALELGAPLLTSPTEDLRHYFGECVAYADEKNSAGSIASAIQSLLSESGDYRKKMVQLRRSKLHEQAGRLTTLVSMLAPEVRALP